VKPLSIRGSLSAWFIGLTALLLIAFSVALYAGVGRTLRAGVDARLTTTASGLAALCEWDEELDETGFEMDPAIAERLAESRPGSGEEIWAWPERRLLHRAGDQWQLPVPTATEPGVRYATYAGEEGDLRVVEALVAMPETVDPEEGYRRAAFSVMVRVVENLTPVAERMARLAWFIAGLALVAGAVIAAFAVLLSRRIVQPLRALGAAAGEIRAGRAAHMPRRGAGDEVDQLGDHLEHAFARLEDSLQRQARFTSDAAHELRNPISVIRNAAEVALRRERAAEEYRAFLTDVLHTATRMGGVVEALLLLARMDAGRTQAQFQCVDLAVVARDAAAAQPEADGRVQVHAPPQPEVAGDPVLLRVLVGNLISNALRYSGRTSPVAVRIERANGALALHVDDEGPGIPPGETAKVFERFYRLESANPGSGGAGLGLALVAEIARIHGAECRMDSAPGRTRVSVTFARAVNGVA